MAMGSPVNGHDLAVVPAAAAPTSISAGQTIGKERPNDTFVDPRDIIGDFDAVELPNTDTQAQRDEKFERMVHINNARMVSYVSIFFCTIFGLCAFAIACIDVSVALFGLAAEFTLDGITSVLVVWRFKKPKVRNFATTDAETNFQAKRDMARERKSGLGVAVTFIFSAVLIFVMAVWKFIAWDDKGAHHEENSSTSAFSELVAWPSCLLFGFLSNWKRKLAAALDSHVLFEDAVCSFLAAVMSGVVIVAGLMERMHVSGAWKADPVAGILIAIVLGLEGSKSLRQHLLQEDDMKHHIMYDI